MFCLILDEMNIWGTYTWLHLLRCQDLPQWGSPEQHLHPHTPRPWDRGYLRNEVCIFSLFLVGLFASISLFANILKDEQTDSLNLLDDPCRVIKALG